MSASCLLIFMRLQVCALKQQVAEELSELTGKHKHLQQDKEAVDSELSALKPAHAELQQIHNKVGAELQSTKAALQKSQDARVHAEVRVTSGFCFSALLACLPCMILQSTHY